MENLDLNRKIGSAFSSKMIRLLVVDELNTLPFPLEVVAQRAGIKPATFRRIINFEHSPSLSTLGCIVSAIKFFKSKL